jgi:site-specific recombinase XerD
MNTPTAIPTVWTATSPLDDVFAAYEAVRQLGPETQTARNYGLAWFGLTRWLAAALDRPPVVADLSTASVTAYLVAERTARGWREQTVQTYASNIRSVVSGCAKGGLVPTGTILGFELPKTTSRAPVFFDDGTLALVFDALEADRTVSNLRLETVANIMLDCGARPEEIANLTFADLYEESSELRFDGKGSKVRVVPVGSRTWVYLHGYMRVRPAPATPADSVFVDVASGAAGVSAGALSKDMHALLVRLGLVVPRHERTEKDGLVSLYTFRKTFARRAAEGGMDVAELAAIMGHSPSSVPMLLRVYYQVSDPQKRAAHASARPADGFHEWRELVKRPVMAPRRTLSFFEEAATPARKTVEGKRPSSAPSSRSRTRGA